MGNPMGGPSGSMDPNERGEILDENNKWLKEVFQGFGERESVQVAGTGVRAIVMRAMDTLKFPARFGDMDVFDQAAFLRAALVETGKHMKLKDPTNASEIHEMLANIQPRDRVTEIIIEAHQKKGE